MSNVQFPSIVCILPEDGFEDLPDCEHCEGTGKDKDAIDEWDKKKEELNERYSNSRKISTD